MTDLATDPVADRRVRLAALTDVLLDVGAWPGETRDAAHGLLELCHEGSGFAPDDLGVTDDGEMHLEAGVVLSRSDAARCLLDHQRTAVFLRGVDDAIRARRSGLGRPVRVLYAGCGPYAALVTPLLGRWSADDVAVTLLDVSDASLTSAMSLVAWFGYSDRIVEAVVADATTWTSPHPPDVVVTETMQAALAKECQVAIVANLAPQLADDGVLVPESVTVDAVAVDPRIEFQVDRQGEEPRVLARLLTLDRDLPPIPDGTTSLPPVSVPLAGLGDVEEVWLDTTITTSGAHRLRRRDSGLTMLRPLALPDRDERGDAVDVAYHLGRHPGFAVTT